MKKKKIVFIVLDVIQKFVPIVQKCLFCITEIKNAEFVDILLLLFQKIDVSIIKMLLLLGENTIINSKCFIKLISILQNFICNLLFRYLFLVFWYEILFNWNNNNKNNHTYTILDNYMFVIIILHNMINQIILVKKSKCTQNRTKHLSKMKYYSIMNYNISIEYESDQINYIFDFSEIVQFYFFTQNFLFSIIIFIHIIIAITLMYFYQFTLYSMIIYILGYLFMIINDYYVLLFKLN